MTLQANAARAIWRMRTQWTLSPKVCEKDGSLKMEYIEDLATIVDAVLSGELVWKDDGSE